LALSEPLAQPSFGSSPGMYLQSIELLGFKSFAHKTLLNFHRGVTAIVGPNGCGKSNVLDAIRWVLGEQSAKALRGGEMADVIFSGTDSRQAVGVAEVSLTFAECEKELGLEYHEVTITRRVYRDGRSDYFLNKVPCRLKDIQMLFMDTGIGRTAYSIMEQGKIDQILSSRPEDRRAIFEEAAGITKYKAQKKEALRKLEYTDANLLRLGDILKEVKRQIGSLQRQAGKARRYQALFENLRTLDLHLAHRNAEEMRRNIREAESEVERLRSVQRSLEEQIESQEFGLTEQRDALEALEEQILTGRQGLQELRSEAERATNRIGFNEERLREGEELTQRYAADVAAAQEKVIVQRNQLDDTDQQLSELFQTLQVEEDHLKERQDRVNQLRESRALQEIATQESQRHIQQRESRLANLRGELASTVNQREAGETRLDLLDQELKQAESARAERLSQIEIVRRESEEAAALTQSTRDALRDREHDLNNLKREFQQAERDLASVERGLAERESRLELLNQLNEEGAGLQVGTQAVLRGLENPTLFRTSILGTLASFLEVDHDFIPAIEAALGDQLQTILIAHPEVAETLAKSLAAGKQGRAAICVRTASSFSSSLRIEALPSGALAWASDRVRAHGEIVPFVNRLLVNVVLAPDLETAFRIKEALPTCAVATLTGEFISEVGVIFAGTSGQANVHSVLQRKAQIRDLETECTEVRKRLANAEQQRALIESELEKMHHRVEEQREEVHRTQITASTLDGRISMLDRDLHEIDGRIKSLSWEKGNTEQRLGSAVARAATLETELGAVSGQLMEWQERLAESLSQIDSLRADEESLTETLHELKVRVATERQRRENLQRQRQPMASRLTELEDLILSRERDIANCRARTRQFIADNESLRGKIEQLEADESKAEAQVVALVEERGGRIGSLEAVEISLRQLRKQLSECQEARGEQEVRATQHKLRLESVREHVTHRYQTELDVFRPDWDLFVSVAGEQRKRLDQSNLDNPETEPLTGSIDQSDSIPESEWDVVRASVAEMSERLDAMGPVNLEAIQEYEELEERQRFLEEQNADLIKSKTELLDVINKINATTKELFAETFERVRKNFQEMFIELFGGGKANLLLVDDADPLESGIEIIAKPPGKQLQSISLLSGGEKTMTAVGLLFAIYMVKPSPFCVLDEMDAPLDESNISRFIKILDRFASQSQFVVITHNKRTIARADVLYGVTMEEHGISKLVGVRLTKQHDADPDLIGAGLRSESLGR
jgi:chromosome segregation protein